MSDLLGVGGNGVLAYQRALVSVSHNIANVATDGYSRQEVNLSALPPRQVGVDYLGTGVMAGTVKRAYDEFVEHNLRQSLSKLEGQGPLVQYANRVVDLMASEQTSLSGAFTRFFESARALAVDPASTISRAAFLREAGGVAQGFRELRNQLDSVEEETRVGLESAASRLNTLASQLAVVNGELQRNAAVSRQAPELLDQRDRLLKDLAGLAQIRTRFAQNGEVSVSLSGSFDKGVLVDRDESARIIAVHEPLTGRVELQIGSLRAREALVGLSGGEIGGLQAIREQVLAPAAVRLDDLARTFAQAVNAAHRQGIDQLGRAGQDLYALQRARGRPRACPCGSTTRPWWPPPACSGPWQVRPTSARPWRAFPTKLSSRRFRPRSPWATRAAGCRARRASSTSASGSASSARCRPA